MQRDATVRISLLLMASFLLLATCLFTTPVFGESSPRKRSKSDRDLNAIGHRKIAHIDANWFSFEKEKEIGAQRSVQFEARSKPLLRDPTTTAYVDRLARTLAQNSDAQIPVTVRIIDSEEVSTLTLPGGYQYITRGLLLQIANEGELASVLSRGLAQTALRSPLDQTQKGAVAMIAATPLTFESSNTSSTGVQLAFLKAKRNEELDADYFALQYLYKSGYDPECFVNFVRAMWPTDPSSKREAELSPFPPLSDRLKALQEEIGEVLPKRDGAVTNTPEFTHFREHLLKLDSPKLER